MEDAFAGPQKHSKPRLVLKSVIGRGAFGSISKGLLNGEIVAVKTLASQRVAQPDGTQELHANMFFREANTLRACEHKRIIGFRSLLRMPAGKSSEPIWALAMEYAKNGNLGQRIAQQMTQPGRSAYSTAQALSWALDIASALEYLHLRSPAVLHRDVKCANILLTIEGKLEVAKLSDFGLHVTADDSKLRALKMIDKAQAAVSKHCHVQVASVTVSTSVASGTSQTPDGSNASNRGSSLNQAAGAPVLPLQGHKPAQSRSASTRAKGATVYMDSQQHDMYTEIHDRCGSRAFLSQCATTAQQRTASLDPDGSSSGGQHCVPVQRVNSFRRASHHPPGEALPRLMSFTSATGNDTCGAQLDTASDANARLFAHWHIAGCVSGEPACSIVSDGTWGTGGTTASRNPGGASDCTDDTCSIYQEVETVFDMTGRTGSCLYMAPEVYLAHSYNEKSDVFSFGVVLYELLARTLVVFTELPTISPSADVAEEYAAKVASGYRPSRPKSKNITDDMWSLITACWQQDPLLRPHMSEVVAVLQGLVMVEGSTPQSTPRRPRSLSLSSSKMSSMPFHSNATAVVSAPAVVNAAAQQGHAKAAAAAAAPRQTQQVCTAGALGGMPETVVAVQQPCDQQAAFESNFLTASKGCCVIA